LEEKRTPVGAWDSGPVFFSQFCDVNKVAIIHKTIHPDLAIQKHETKFFFKDTEFWLHIIKIGRNFLKNWSELGTRDQRGCQTTVGNADHTLPPVSPHRHRSRHFRRSKRIFY
jgi:hypothetical protein